MMDNCNSVSFWSLIGDWSRGRMLVSQKRPIRLMQIYDTESAKLLLLMSVVYRYKFNFKIVKLYFMIPKKPKPSTKYWNNQY